MRAMWDYVLSQSRGKWSRELTQTEYECKRQWLVAMAKLLCMWPEHLMYKPTERNALRHAYYQLSVELGLHIPTKWRR